MVVLDLCCCTWAFSSCGCFKQGLLFVTVPALLSQRLLLWESTGCSAHGFQYLQQVGSLALRHVESTLTRARTRVLYISRGIFIHCITREVSLFAIFSLIFIFIFLSNFIAEFSPSLQALLPSIHFQVSTRPHALPSMDMWLGVTFHCYIYLFLSLLYCIHLVFVQFYFVCHRAHLYFGFYLLSFLSAYLLMHSISKFSRQKNLSTFRHIRYSVGFILFMETRLLKSSGFVVLQAAV